MLTNVSFKRGVWESFTCRYIFTRPKLDTRFESTFRQLAIGEAFGNSVDRFQRAVYSEIAYNFALAVQNYF